MSRSQAGGRIAIALVAAASLFMSQGCMSLAETMGRSGDGVAAKLVQGGFLVGAALGVPVAVAAAPLTLPLAALSNDGHGGVGIVLAPAIATGAVVGAAFGIPGLLVEAPVWLAEAIDGALQGERPPPAPWTGPAPDPPEAPDPTSAESPPPELADGPEPEPEPADESCLSLALADLLPPHERGVGLTQALFEALANPAARVEAERLLVTRPDAVPLLLVGLEDRARGQASARILAERGDDPGVTLGLVNTALDIHASEDARLLARFALLSIEARRKNARR